MRRDRWFVLVALLFLVLTVAAVGCGARNSGQAPPAAEEVESAGAATESTAAAEQQSDDGDDFADNCHGVLNCTFFGLGAVIAAPFWVLGAVLGLAF